jgi:WD40 repeat protein
LEDTSVSLWDADTGELLWSDTTHQGPVMNVSWSSENSLLGSSDSNGSVIIWDPESGQAIHQEFGISGYSVAFSPDGHSLATVSYPDSSNSDSDELTIWETGRWTKLAVIAVKPLGTTLSTGIVWSPTGDQIASTISGTPVIWQLESMKLIHTRRLPIKTGELDWSPDGKYLALSGDTARVIRSDFQIGDSVTKLEGDHTYASDVKWSPDGKAIASPIGAQIIIWDPRTGRIIERLQTSEPVFKVAWSPDGSRLAAGISNGTVEILDVKSGKIIATLKIK